MSSEILKQLKIKTSILKRLCKEFESYQEETKQIQVKIQRMEMDLPNAHEKEEGEIQIRKNKEFLVESQSVLTNVKQKFIEAFEVLATFLSEKGQQEGINGTEEKTNAQNLVLNIQTFLQSLDQ